MNTGSMSKTESSNVLVKNMHFTYMLQLLKTVYLYTQCNQGLNMFQHFNQNKLCD
jgi:hypothetical protein